jgi:hypothetical protein
MARCEKGYHVKIEVTDQESGDSDMDVVIG